MMKKPLIISFFILALFVVVTCLVVTRDIDAATDEKSFVNEFIAAYTAKDNAKIEELVKRAPHFIYKGIIELSDAAITAGAEGKDGSEYFDFAEIMAKIYAKEFNKGELVGLVRRYKKYTPEICRERLKADEVFLQANTFYEKGQRCEAEEGWMEALRIYKKIGDAAREVKVLSNIGLGYKNLGRYAEAVNYAKQAIEINRKIGSLQEEAAGLTDIGDYHLKLYQYTETLNYRKQALEINRKIGNEAGEAADLTMIGYCYYRLAQYTDAFNYLKQAIEINRKINDVAEEAAGLTNLGEIYRIVGQYTEALNSHKQALEILNKINNPYRKANVLANIGLAYETIGEYAKALDFDKQALEIFRKIDKGNEEAKVLGNIGLVYDRLGLNDEALNYHKQALEIFRKTDDLVEQAETLTNIGMIQDKHGNHTEAMKYYKQALEIDRKTSDVVGEANCLGNIGTVYDSLREYTEALKNYKQALEIYRKIGDLGGQAAVLANAGKAYYSLGYSDKAIEALQAAVKISEALDMPEEKWRCCLLLGKALWKSGRVEEAVNFYGKAIATIEQIYFTTVGLKEEERLSMIGKKSYVYQEFIELLLELHKKFPDKGYDKDAFKVSEKSKSRTFQELMAKAGAKIAFSEEARDTTFGKMIEKEQRLIGEIASLQGLLTKERSKPEKEKNEAAVTSLKEQLARMEKAFQEHEKEIDATYPRYADLKRPEPLTVTELQKILKPDETVLAYALGKDTTVAFIITRERFRLVELGISPGELAPLVQKFRNELAGIRRLKDLENFDPESAYTLYQKLIARVFPKLKGVIRLFISAEGILYTLPFEALVDQVDKEAFTKAREQGKQGGAAYLGEYGTLHYLVDTYAITYLPSASVLRSLRKHGKPGYGTWTKPLIAFADPIFSEKEENEGGGRKGVQERWMSHETVWSLQLLTRSTGTEGLPRLKASSQEANAIAEEVKGKKEDVYLRDKATEENVHKARLHDAHYLLFSTHGLLGGEFKGVAEPSLVLTLINNPPRRDGFLTMSKVLGLDLNAELAILSACNTVGEGDKAGAGEGFVGLTRSFMYAGARSILVTQWSVDPEAARDLMVTTMKLMNNGAKPESLRKAKLSMKSSTRQMGKDKLSLSHPYYWAPFVLVGEGE